MEIFGDPPILRNPYMWMMEWKLPWDCSIQTQINVWGKKCEKLCIILTDHFVRKSDLFCPSKAASEVAACHVRSFAPHAVSSVAPEGQSPITKQSAWRSWVEMFTKILDRPSDYSKTASILGIFNIVGETTPVKMQRKSYQRASAASLPTITNASPFNGTTRHSGHTGVYQCSLSESETFFMWRQHQLRLKDLNFCSASGSELATGISDFFEKIQPCTVQALLCHSDFGWFRSSPHLLHAGAGEMSPCLAFFLNSSQLFGGRFSGKHPYWVPYCFYQFLSKITGFLPALSTFEKTFDQGFFPTEVFFLLDDNHPQRIGYSMQEPSLIDSYSHTFSLKKTIVYPHIFHYLSWVITFYNY